MENCQKEVYEKGEVVFITHTISSKNIETWVQKIASDSGQKVDWHWYAGRAAVKAVGDLKKVKSSILKNKEMHDFFMMDALQEFDHCKGQLKENEQTINGIWSYNGF